MGNSLKRWSYRESVRDFLIGLSRPSKKFVVVSSDIFGLTACALAAGWLLSTPNLLSYPLLLACLGIAVFGVVLAWGQGLYRSVVRYVGADLFAAGAKTSAPTAIVGAGILTIGGMGESPVRWLLAFAGLSFIYICGSRFAARIFLIRPRAAAGLERVVIYGAGSSGAQLALSLLGADEFLPVAIVDDDVSLHGTTVKGLQVFSPSALGRLIEARNVTRVLLAMPSASRHQRKGVLQYLTSFPVHVQTMPNLKDLISGKARVDEIREVSVGDLLGRDPVPPNPELLGASITGKHVMVTGAGGSIGSELCRQIIRLKPATLVLFELSEYSLYLIEKELREIGRRVNSECKIMPLLGSVHHRERVQEILETFNVETLYHAAAYKHVPLVELNILEGVHNNVIGTMNLANAAAAAKVKCFVLISTDKAVSPTNVMGATKRFAELILQALQDDHSETCFCMVRFGNVLESSGSVVPLFREQIRSGGPVTVTHREIIRYFMTIPEAAQLVIQTASMARGGDVFVLDMGKPVKILDLAQRMIHLMGLSVRDDANPEGDIEVEFTGLRPAEKLYEELLIGSDISGTEHPRILRARENKVPIESLKTMVDDLQSAMANLDRDLTRKILMRAVVEYCPRNDVEDLVWVNQQGQVQAGHAATIVDFPGAAVGDKDTH